MTTLGVGGVFWAARNFGVQDEALLRAQNNPAVVERLGEPIEIGWLMSGNISFENDTGQADYSIPISGPNGRGKLYILAYREDSEWRFEELYILINGERFDLAGDSLPTDASAGTIGAETASDASAEGSY